jgi:hypothetical protein
MPVTSDGHKVATLIFESAQKGLHLSASLMLPSGEVIATFQRGTAPRTVAWGVLNSLGQDLSSAAAAPPVVIALVGQPYGFFKPLGAAGTKGAMGGILDGTEFRHVDSSRAVASTAELEVSLYLCCIPGGYKFTPAKKSSLGVKEAPLPVHFGSGCSTTAPADGIIHLILPRTRFFFPVYEVLCEVQCLGSQDKLDILLMGAAMAAINATAKQQSPGGM